MQRLSILILLLFASPAVGQIRVNQNGGAPFRDLQAAVDFAVSGDIIIVEGGTYSSIRVEDKSLTIIGSPRFEIVMNLNGRIPCGGPYTFCQPAGIELSGTGTFSLIGARIHGSWGGELHVGGSCIRNQGLRTIHLIECILEAPRAMYMTGSWSGVSAISSSAGAHLFLERTVASASIGGDIGIYCVISPRMDGVPGIYAPGCFVSVFDSVVNGGNGADIYIYCAPSAPCPCYGPGYYGFGAVAIEAERIVEVSDVGSGMHGGRGGEIYVSGQGSWGRQPDGRPYQALAYELVSGRLSSALHWYAGESVTLASDSQGPSLFLVGFLSPVPEIFLSRWNWMDFASGFIVVPSLGRSLTVPIPNDSLFYGLTVVVHGLDVYGTLLAPVARIIEP